MEEEITVENVNPSTIEQVKEALEPVVQKLGEGAEFGYEIIMRQVIGEAIVAFLISFIVFVIGTILYFKFILPKIVIPAVDRKKVKEAHDKKYKYIEFDETDYAFTLMFVGLFHIPAVLVLMAVVEQMAKSILVFVNPHFYTIQRVIEFARDAL